MSTRIIYDPFGWRLEELARPDLNPLRRAELLDGLLVAEAEELAMGRRHITIVHGEPTDVAEVEELNRFYDVVGEIVQGGEWSRLAGSAAYVTVTLAGNGRDDALARLIEIAVRRAASDWQILDAPHAVREQA